MEVCVVSEKFRRFAGIDWGHSEHEVCVLDEAGERVGQRRVKATGEGHAALIEWLLRLADGDVQSMAVIIERGDGPLVESLIDRGFAVYLIHPKQLDRFRDRHTSAGAKDDRLDALVGADAGRTDLHKLRRIRVLEADVIMLRELSRLRGTLQDERLRLCEQLRAQLFRFFPQAIELDSIDSPWFWALLEKMPSPQAAAKARPVTIAPILKAHRIRRLTATEVLRTLQVKPVTVAPGVIEAASMHIRSILTRLRVVDGQLRETDKAIGALLQPADPEQPSGQKCEHRDADIIRSLPGFGIHNVAAVLAEAPEPIADRDYEALVSRSGVAPVTRQTGKQKQRSRRNHQGPRPQVLMRRACNERLREAAYHAGRTAAQHDPRCKQIYDAARARGIKHGAATRIVAQYLFRVLISMLKSRTLYDPKRASVTATNESEAA
jgi:hypothetical protein